MRRSCVVALTGAFFGSAVGADQMEDLFGSEETVTIATGRAHAYRTAPAVATVITAEDIRNGGYRNVVEALQLVPAPIRQLPPKKSAGEALNFHNRLMMRAAACGDPALAW